MSVMLVEEKELQVMYGRQRDRRGVKLIKTSCFRTLPLQLASYNIDKKVYTNWQSIHERWENVDNNRRKIFVDYGLFNCLVCRWGPEHWLCNKWFVRYRRHCFVREPHVKQNKRYGINKWYVPSIPNSQSTPYIHFTPPPQTPDLPS